MGRIAKITISLPEELIPFADEMARKKRISRSKVFSICLREMAAAHTTRCPYCIDGHTRAAKRAGATNEEIAEAIFVATAMNAGASLAHSNIAMQALENK